LTGRLRVLHRVLTDDLRIVCPAGGSVEYRIDVSG
jgi:hypothetical protein